MKWNEFATNLTGEWEIERERKRKRKLRKSIRIMRYHAMGWAHISEFLYKPLYTAINMGPCYTVVPTVHPIQRGREIEREKRH